MAKWALKKNAWRQCGAPQAIKEAFTTYAKYEKFFGMERINLDQLHGFATAIELGSFSAAAQRLDLTQPL